MCCRDFMKRLVVFAIFLNQIYCSDRFDCKFEKLDNKDFQKIIQLAEYQGDVVEIKLEHDDVKDFVKKEVDIPFALGSNHFYNCDIDEVVKKCFRKLLEKRLGLNFVLRCDVYFLLKNGTQEDIGDNYKGEIDDTNPATFFIVQPELGLSSSELMLFYIDSSNTITINTDFSIDQKINWSFKASSSWNRNSNNSLLLLTTNALWKKSRDMDFKSSVRDTASISLSRQNKINKQTYEYKRSAELSFLNNVFMTSGAGILFGFEQGKTFRLSISYNLGIKINY